MYKMSLMPLYTAEAIQEMVQILSEKIARNYKFDVVVGLLTGSFVFASDLCRHFPDKKIKVHFIKASSYGDATESSGKLNVSLADDLDITGKKVLLVDDILDTGLTLQEMVKFLQEKGAAEVRSCVLLEKRTRRKANIKADFVGFSIEDGFVVGYGLDYAGEYRTMPDIWTLENEN